MSDYLYAKTENVQRLLDNCLKKQKQELISEFVNDLDYLIYNRTVSSNGKIFISLDLTKELKKKWEEKLK